MRKRRRSVRKETDIELNVIPFIDIFSLLAIFLLSTAVFVSVGTHRVQIPFLSNAPVKKEKPQFKLDLSLSVSRTKVELSRNVRSKGKGKSEREFDLTTSGLLKLNRELASVKKMFPKVENVTLYSEDDVTYQNLISVLDSATMLMSENRSLRDDGELEDFSLFPKVVFGSVLH